MTEGDRAPVDVDDVLGDGQVADGLEHHGRERLVDLDQVQVGHGQPGLAQRVADRPGWL